MPSGVFTLVMIMLLIPILAVLLDSHLVKAIAKRLERGRLREGGEPTHERLVYLESELDRLGKDVERLDEESRFLQNLLAERAESGRLPPGEGARRDRGGADQAPEHPGPAGRPAGRGSPAA